jgi:hypothetical protein
MSYIYNILKVTGGHNMQFQSVPFSSKQFQTPRTGRIRWIRRTRQKPGIRGL